MRRGTTPTVTFTVSSKDGSALDLTGADIYVTFKEKSKDGSEITKSGEDVSVTTSGLKSVISVTLTQEDTLSFHAGKSVRAQIRSKRSDVAMATDIVAFSVDEILKDGEI